MAVTGARFNMLGLTAGLFALISVLLFSVTASSQDLATETPMNGFGLHINQDLSLNTFDGASITWNRYSSPKRGWRIALSPRIDKTTYPNYYYQDLDDEENRYSLEISALRLFQKVPKERSRFYWGIGPTLHASYYENIETWQDSNGMVSPYMRVYRIWSIGAANVIGIEYFLSDKISLLGEYGFNLVYEDYKSSHAENHDKSIRIFSKSVQLGLNVFF